VWRAKVRVEAAGAWHEHQIAQIPGDPGRPFALSDVAAKFHKLADSMIGADAVDRFVNDTIAVLDGRVAPGKLLSSIASVVS
jgi:hypothetical protein